MWGLQRFFTLGDFTPDFFDGCTPEEHWGVRVVSAEVWLDGRDQLRDILERAPTDALVGDLAEPPFDPVEPGARRGEEVPRKSRVPLQPGWHAGMRVRPGMVNEEVPIQVLRGADIAELQEAMSCKQR